MTDYSVRTQQVLEAEMTCSSPIFTQQALKIHSQWTNTKVALRISWLLESSTVPMTASRGKAANLKVKLIFVSLKSKIRQIRWSIL